MKTLLFLLLALPCIAAQSVTLSWNPNIETNLAGYRLYYGTATRTYSTNVPVLVPSTSVTITNLSNATTYHFAVTAYTDEGLESVYSDEVSYKLPSLPPAKPTNLRITTSLQAYNTETKRWTNAWTISAPIDDGSPLHQKLTVTTQPSQSNAMLIP